MGEIRQKVTKRERRERVDLCVRMLATGYRPGEIKRLLSTQWVIARRSVEHYLCSARRELAEDCGKPQSEHRHDSYAFYTERSRDSKVHPAVQIKARERIDKLLGLEAPMKVAQTDTEGNDLEIAAESLTQPQRDALVALELCQRGVKLNGET